MSAKKKLAIYGIASLLTLVASFEGRLLVANYDPVGIPTLCFGHTAGVKIGDRATPEQCEELLAEDLLAANTVVDSCVTVPLNANQRSALVSFAYNVGHGRAGVKDGLCVLKNGQPSTLRRLLNTRNYTAACNQLINWTFGKGQHFAGLKKRREKERELCLTPVEVEASHAP